MMKTAVLSLALVASLCLFTNNDAQALPASQVIERAHAELKIELKDALTCRSHQEGVFDYTYWNLDLEKAFAEAGFIANQSRFFHGPASVGCERLEGLLKEHATLAVADVTRVVTEEYLPVPGATCARVLAEDIQVRLPELDLAFRGDKRSFVVGAVDSRLCR